jgi:hypothetical protein
MKQLTPKAAASVPPATPAVNAPRIPSIEEQIAETEQDLAMLLLMTSARASSMDDSLSEQDQDAAWDGIANVVTRSLENLRATKGALTAGTMNTKAPDAAGGAR